MQVEPLQQNKADVQKPTRRAETELGLLFSREKKMDCGTRTTRSNSFGRIVGSCNHVSFRFLRKNNLKKDQEEEGQKRQTNNKTKSTLREAGMERWKRMGAWKKVGTRRKYKGADKGGQAQGNEVRGRMNATGRTQALSSTLKVTKEGVWYN